MTAAVRESATTTVCRPWKGTASYLSIEVDGQVVEDAAWRYPTTKHPAAEIWDRVAFWKGVQVTP